MKKHYFSVLLGLLSLYSLGAAAQCPTVNAGPDLTVCSNQASVSLSGTVNNASSKIWKTSGTGYFSDSLGLTTNYIPTPSDISLGSVRLTLLAIGDTCQKSDELTLTLLPSPVVNAGADTSVCSTSPVSLNGSALNAPQVTWSTTGSGVFLPNPSALNATYSPSNVDIAGGSVTLVLSASSSGTCLSVQDSKVINFNNQFVVNAGPDEVVCANQINISLTATSSSETIQWSTNGSGSFSNALSKSTIYFPAAADIAAGTITVTISTTGGACASSQDSKTITFVELPTVSATSNGQWDTIVCPGTPVPLEGVANNPRSIQWGSSGTGTFTPGRDSLKTTYIPSVLDVMNGVVHLSITTVGFAMCADSDTLTVHFSSPSTVHAGPDQLVDVSGNYSGTQLNGSINNAQSSAVWTTSGTGVFAPSNGIPNPVYVPSVADKASGSVLLTLQSVGESNCGLSVADNMTLTFVSTPLASISGSISLDTAKAKQSFVALFKETNGYYALVDSSVTVSGDYTFSNLTPGNYVVYASPNFTLSSAYLPTYSGNAKEWSNAQVIKLEDLNITLNDIVLIHFVENSDWNTGVDNIAGVVTLKDINARVAVASLNSVQGVTVYLMDENGNDLAYTVTNEFGMYKFTNVANGNYLLRFEYPGIKPVTVPAEADGDPSTLSTASPELERTSIVSSIYTAGKSAAGELKAFPNPASDYVHFNLTFNEGFEYSIMNSTGSVVAEGVERRGDTAISLQDVKPGLYLIKVIQGNNVYKSKIYKQ